MDNDHPLKPTWPNLHQLNGQGLKLYTFFFYNKNPNVVTLFLNWSPVDPGPCLAKCLLNFTLRLRGPNHIWVKFLRAYRPWK